MYLDQLAAVEQAHEEASAVLAMPSRCSENQPLIVLEAFAPGLAVVASAIGVTPSC